MSGWLPDPSPSTLIPPNRDHPFFNFATTHPFDYLAQDYSAANAAWLADLALLAYDDPVHVEPALAIGGFHLYGRQPINAEGGRGAAQVYVAHDEHSVLVAFRGTEIPVTSSSRGFLSKTFDSLQDTLTNARLKFTPVADGVCAHCGFVAALDEVWDDLLEGWIAPLIDGPAGRKVWFTGHSLGAAMATLAAWRYGECAGLYTFASPRVGDAAFAAAIDDMPAWRVALKDDFVTTVPPSRSNPRIDWIPDGYCHGGKLIHIDADGVVSHGPRDEEPPAGVVELAAGISSPIDTAARHLGSLEGIGSLVDNILSGDASRDVRDFAHQIYDHAPLYYALTMRHLADIGSSDEIQT